MNRGKLFIENFLFFGGLTVFTKALPIIMLPIITRFLTDTSVYGIADMFNVIGNFGIQIAVLGVGDALFREYFEESNDSNHKLKVLSTSLWIVLISSTIILIIFTVFYKSIGSIFFSNKKFNYLIIVSGIFIFLNTVNLILQAPFRIKNQRKIIFYISIIVPILSYIIIIFLIKIGYTFEALIYPSIIINIIFMLIYLKLNYEEFNLKYFDAKIMKELLKIGLPLVPTFLVYWVFSGFDRIMIEKMLGTNELGIYSLGARIATISQIIQAAFAGGWQYFAFSTMNDDDQVTLNSKIFEYLSIVSFSAFIIILPFYEYIFITLFKGDYVKGSTVFPYLFLSPLLLILFQTISSQTIIIKKSYLSTLCLFFGGTLNIFLNYVLIKICGIKGAAIATLISYFSSVTLMILILKFYKLENIKMRFYILSLIVIGIVAFKFFEFNYLLIILSIVFFIGLFNFYSKDIIDISKKILR